MRTYLQQLLIKPATRRVAGQSPAIGFILLFVKGLNINHYQIYYGIRSRNIAAIAVSAASQIPRSVIKPLTSLAGVISNP